MKIFPIHFGYHFCYRCPLQMDTETNWCGMINLFNYLFIFSYLSLSISMNQLQRQGITQLATQSQTDTHLFHG